MPGPPAQPYALDIAPRAQKDLDALDRRIRDRVARALDRLRSDPFSAANVRALVGIGGSYRLRVGDVRLLYEVNRGRLVVLVVTVGHRREVYR